jgi:hypothetical protein
MNILKKSILLLILFIGISTQSMPFKDINDQFVLLAQAYYSKDTSLAFSIAMKVYTSVSFYMSETNIINRIPRIT